MGIIIGCLRQYCLPQKQSDKNHYIYLSAPLKLNEILYASNLTSKLRVCFENLEVGNGRVLSGGSSRCSFGKNVNQASRVLR